MGFGSPATEELADTITVGEYLIRDKDASYLLEVTGSALQDMGLLEGDMVVFERSHSYKVGDLVVTLSDDGYELKQLGKDTKRIEIVGVVTGSFRSYK